MEEGLNSITHINFNNGPEVLKKETRYTIRPKSLVRLYEKLPLQSQRWIYPY